MNQLANIQRTALHADTVSTEVLKELSGVRKDLEDSRSEVSILKKEVEELRAAPAPMGTDQREPEAGKVSKRKGAKKPRNKDLEVR